MKVKYISDIHLECFKNDRFGMRQALSSFESVTKDDILILAGDICYPLTQGDLLLDHFCKIAGEVLYVAGNHEYYKSSLLAIDEHFKDYDNKTENFHYLNNRVLTIGGVTFIGGTGWSNVSGVNCSSLNDFHTIDGMTPDIMNSLHEEYKSFMQSLVIKGMTVMISHFLPSKLLIEPKWRGDSLNNYFCNGVYDNSYNLNPDYWIYGHDHNESFILENNGTKFLTSQGDYGKWRFSLGELET